MKLWVIFICWEDVDTDEVPFRAFISLGEARLALPGIVYKHRHNSRNKFRIAECVVQEMEQK